MKTIFLTTLLFCSSYFCFGQSLDTVKLNRSYIISMSTKRMHVYKQSRKDIYKTTVIFRNPDSSQFTLIFRGQEPLPVNFSGTEENILPIIDGVKCYFQLNHYYDLKLFKVCRANLIGHTYYSYFVDFDKNDCAKINNTKRLKKGYIVQQMHPYVEVGGYLYQMDVDNCTTKFDNN